MEALKTIPYIFLILAIAGVIAGASVLSISKFSESMTPCMNASFTYNSTLDWCVNNSLSAGANSAANRNMTDEYYATHVSLMDGMGTVSGQFSTIGIIAIMVVIISLISGVFAYMAYFR